MILRGSSRRSIVPGPMERRSNCCCLVRGFELHYPTTSFLNVFGIILVLTLLVVTGVSQQPSGFISIDCGGKGGRDPLTGLEWVADDGFLDSAKQLADDGFFISATVRFENATVTSQANAEQLRTAMVFVPVVSDLSVGVGSEERVSRSKFCYILNVTYDESNLESTNYLVRAMFPSRNLTASLGREELNRFGTRFYFTVDSTFVATIELHPVKPQTIELKVTPIGDRMYVCLVPLEDRSSMPAISSLELRPLPVELYNTRGSSASDSGIDSSSETTYFMTVSRLNFGANESLPAIRYPLDKYDRLWYPAPIPEEKLGDIIPRRAVNTSASLVAKIQPPPEVLLSAWEGRNMSSEISFTIAIGKARSYRRIRSFVSTLLFFDVIPGGRKDIRQVTVTNRGTNLKTNTTFSGDVNDSTIISDQRVSELYDATLFLAHHLSTFTIKPHRNSTLPAMVNAIELYGTFTALTQRTENTSAATIRKFLNSLVHNLDTTGDACLPVPWMWLVCSIEVPPRITQIILPGVGVRGNITKDLGSLDRLTVLDLSDNGFRGSLPQSLVELVTLRTLNLGNNLLHGVLPPFKEKSLVNLETLSLRSNAFNGSLSSLIKALDSPVSSIDLSDNHFDGSIPVDIKRLTSLQSLDLSFNNLAGTLPVELVTLPELKDLSLQNNSLTGVVPAEIWSNNSKLETVSLSYNSFTELNLTTWFQNVVAKKRLDVNQPKVSLIGNPIRNVILPSEEVIDRLHRPSPASVKKMTDPQSSGGPKPGPDRSGFVLLGEDNPWCQSFEKSSETLLQRYLCRSAGYEDFWEPRTVHSSSSSKTAISIVSAISGVLVLSMVCVLAILLWRMLKRTRDLRQIQEALAKDDVRPPFFKYEDLKAATRDFSKDNELGKGAFGAVYKILISSWIRRDIKPQNILLDKNWNAKIADFGLARPASGDEDSTQYATRVGGTLGYFSPEYATLGIFTEKLDVYSYGVLVLEIVSGRRCIDLSLSEEEMYLKKWAFDLYKEDKLLDIAENGLLAMASRDEVEAVLKTALSCLQDNYDKRPSMSQVVNMLTGNLSDLGIDIVTELKDHQRLCGDILDESTNAMVTTPPKREFEGRALLGSSPSSDPERAIELSITIPR